MSAKIGNNPSFLWRGLIATQDILRTGARRRVGDGLDINILHEPWLPSSDTPYICSNNPGLVNQRVADLFKIDALEWDSDIIKDMFSEREASLILNIPLVHSRKDSWFWAEETSGELLLEVYTVSNNESKTLWT